MAKLTSHAASKTHRCIIYGAPKAGKSLLAGKLAEHFKIIWIDMENGHETLFQLPLEWQENIELVKLPDTRMYPIAIETCLKLVKGPVEICEEHGKVACMVCKREKAEVIQVNLPAMGADTVVVFDSLTQLTNSAIAHITKGESDDYKLNYDDWGNLGKLLDIFLSQLQQAKYNVIVISHETEAETEGKKKTLVPVGGTRNMSRNVAKYFDHVIYAERKNKKHVFASSSCYATNILTGSRTGTAMEDNADGSLLAIFKPELYKTTASTITPAATAATAKPTGGAETTSSILARLQSKKQLTK